MLLTRTGKSTVADIEGIDAQFEVRPTSRTPDAKSEAPEPTENRWTPITPIPDDAPKVCPHPYYGDPTGGWVYHDEYGECLAIVGRFDPPDGRKRFVPYTYCENAAGDREWRLQALPEPRPLYGLDRLAARSDDPVVVCEGEKAADAAKKLLETHVAITSHGGCNRAGEADWTPLKGRAVVIWPDADEQGQKYAAAVAQQCREVGATSIHVITRPVGVVEGWDAADALADGWTAEQAKALVTAARDAAEPGLTGTEASLIELARLSDIEYEQHRKDEAKRLRVRVTALDKEVKKLQPGPEKEKVGAGQELKLFTPEPWPEPVDGGGLLDELVATFKRYLALAEGAPAAMALWVLNTHTFGVARINPRLAFISPEHRCGKTTALSVLNCLVPRPLLASNATGPVIFRVVELATPTLLVDEADTFLSGKSDLLGILNSGHTQDAAFVIRTVGDDYEPRRFSTWAPMAIAKIGRLPATLEDRSITIEMRRRLQDERIERFRSDRTDDLNALNSKACRWAIDHLGALRRADPELPGGLHDRAADNWRPLTAIADIAGGHWPDTARKVAVSLSGDKEDPSYKVQLLADIRSIFDAQGKDRLPSKKLCRALGEMEDRRWGGWNKNFPIEPRNLAQLLDPFDIKPHTVRIDDETPKGYLLKDFEDAFQRYLD